MLKRKKIRATYFIEDAIRSLRTAPSFRETNGMFGTLMVSLPSKHDPVNPVLFLVRSHIPAAYSDNGSRTIPG